MRHTLLKKLFSLQLAGALLFTALQGILYYKAQAQVKGGQHTKLFDMYALEKYEDCAYKAENMTMNDKYKKDPEPLLYLSMCMLKISKMDSSKLDQQYKDPMKESLKYAKKFRAKDKDGSMYAQNTLFFDDLKTEAIYHANALYNQNQYGKAAAFFGMINAFDDKDDNVRLMKGICDLLAKNAVEGNKNINDAMKGLVKARSDSAFKPDNTSEPLLIDALMIYSDYLNNNKMEDSAKKTIAIAKSFFPDNFEIKNQYNLLYGLPPEEKPSEEDSKKTEKRYEFHQPKENVQIPPTENSNEIKTDSTLTEPVNEKKDAPVLEAPEKENGEGKPQE